MSKEYKKDPQATLDYTFDWSDWLNDSDSIATNEVTVSSVDITLESKTANAGAVTAWISGGVENKRYGVTCKITTAEGRIDERTIYLYVLNR